MVLWSTVGVALSCLREISVESHIVTTYPHNSWSQSAPNFPPTPANVLCNLRVAKEKIFLHVMEYVEKLFCKWPGGFWGFSWIWRKIQSGKQNSLLWILPGKICTNTVRSRTPANVFLTSWEVVQTRTGCYTEINFESLWGWASWHNFPKKLNGLGWSKSSVPGIV